MRTLRILTVAFTLVASVPSASATGLPPGGSFVDDDGSVHEGMIEAIASIGVTLGCNPPTGDRFCPGAPVTRGQMAAFLVRALGIPVTGGSQFTDVPGSVFADDVAALANAGITMGCNPPENDHFCPDEPVTRGQMAAFLVRGFGYPPGLGGRFADDDDSVFERDIESLAAAGVTVGCNPPVNDRFCPGDLVSRAEMASFLGRALELDPVSVAPRPHVVTVVPRAEWGAVPPTGAYRSHDIEQLTVHHAGSLRGTTGPAQFRGWQRYHQSLGWPDIAYHFIIGSDGAVYEGRPYLAVGDTATSYDPTGHFLVVVEGNFDDDTPSPAQIESLARMLAWASVQFGIAPGETTGHRDHAATSCPGDALYERIHDGSLAARVAEIIESGGVTLELAS